MTPELAEQAKKYLEDLLTFFEVNPKVEVRTEGETIELEVEAEDTGRLIGHRGENLAALQHLLNMMIRRQTRERVYVHIDVGGYRQQRLEKLGAQAEEMAAKVEESGEEAILPSMSPAERRHIHSLLSERVGVVTESRGEGKARRLVIKRG